MPSVPLGALGQRAISTTARYLLPGTILAAALAALLSHLLHSNFGLFESRDRSMAPLTACLFILVSAILYRAARQRNNRISLAIAALLALLCLLWTIWYGTPFLRGLEPAALRFIGFHAPEPFPRMSQATALAFAILGLALTTDSRGRSELARSLPAAILVELLLCLAGFCLLEYRMSGDARTPAPWGGWISNMAAESAVLFCLAALAIALNLWARTALHARRRGITAGLLVCFALLPLFFGVNVTLSIGQQQAANSRRDLAEAQTSVEILRGLTSAVRRAEAGQRGYLLTEDPRYLDAFRAGDARFAQLSAKPMPEGANWPEMRTIRELAQQKMAELHRTIQLEQDGRRSEALAAVRSGEGLFLMNRIEALLIQLNADFQDLLTRHDAEYQTSADLIRRSILASYSLAAALLLCAAWLFRREIIRREFVEQQLRANEHLLEHRIAARTAELSASEARYRAMLEQSPLAIHVLDDQGNHRSVNPAFERLFGLSDADLAGYCLWADPQPAANGTAGLLKRTFAGEAVSTGAMRHDAALSVGKGLAAWIEVIAYPIQSAERKVSEVVLMILDVTERETAAQRVRESESRFRRLCDIMPQIVWVAGANGEIEYYNERWYELTGQVRGRTGDDSWVPFIHTDDLAICMEASTQSIRERRPSKMELRIWDNTRGEYRWYLARTVPVYDESGELRNWFGTSTDIHDRKEAEAVLDEKVKARTAELQFSYDMLRTSEEALRRSLSERETLLKEVHHRVKNNLQVISSLLRMQGDGLREQPAAAAALEDSRRRVMAMAMIHEQLYANDSMNQIDLGEYAHSLTHELIYSYALPGQAIAGNVLVDRVLLDVEHAIPCGLILNELVTNAVKYAFRGRDRGEIKVELTDAAADELMLAVTDDGVGLPAGLEVAKLPSLGLPMVEILARQIGGRLSISSGSGSQFIVRFPKPVRSGKAA